ncbi:hypothetical protein ACIBBB_33370 [Streptomyces sp. NPDC051217]|uniref:hypothetical protein n=1 Tax=Streptomyces sp. NPDC051217 TaxID=3365644 RepID=UPI00379515A2
MAMHWSVARIALRNGLAYVVGSTSHGKLLSTFYLFETPIQDACKVAGLVRPGGRAGHVSR